MQIFKKIYLLKSVRWSNLDSEDGFITYGMYV